MLQQPVESSGDAWLDPGQFVALAAMLAGGWVFTIGSRLNPMSENPDPSASSGQAKGQPNIDVVGAMEEVR
jgi:hypothetical protein